MNPIDEFCFQSSPKTNSEPTKAYDSTRVTAFPMRKNSCWPPVHRITRNARAICSPRPHNTILGLMARRLVENRYANASMVSNPSTPVNRPIQCLLAYAGNDRHISMAAATWVWKCSDGEDKTFRLDLQITVAYFQLES